MPSINAVPGANRGEEASASCSRPYDVQGCTSVTRGQDARSDHPCRRRRAYTGLSQNPGSSPALQAGLDRIPLLLAGQCFN